MTNPLTTGPSRAAARAMLKGAGFSDEDLRKPLIGIANTWIEIGPCNLNLRELAEHVKAGVRAAGGTPMEFSMGRTPKTTAPDSTAAKTSSKLLHGTNSASAFTRRDAASLNAPGSP